MNPQKSNKTRVMNIYIYIHIYICSNKTNIHMHDQVDERPNLTTYTTAEEMNININRVLYLAAQVKNPLRQFHGFQGIIS